jgi:hypothetical protein
LGGGEDEDQQRKKEFCYAMREREERRKTTIRDCEACQIRSDWEDYGYGYYKLLFYTPVVVGFIEHSGRARAHFTSVILGREINHHFRQFHFLHHASFSGTVRPSVRL